MCVLALSFFFFFDSVSFKCLLLCCGRNDAHCVVCCIGWCSGYEDSG